MKKMRFKDIFTIICTLAAIISSIAIICTFLTTYHFIYVAQIFSSYFTLQVLISITMFLWALRFFFYRKGRERITYTGICISISILLIFFVVNRIF